MTNTINTTHDDIITADNLSQLPEPVRRYLTHAVIIATPWIKTARLRYRGKFRTGADKPWMGITAIQVYQTNPPTFHWQARLSIMGLPVLSGIDTYKDGHGHMFAGWPGCSPSSMHAGQRWIRAR